MLKGCRNFIRKIRSALKRCFHKIAFKTLLAIIILMIIFTGAVYIIGFHTVTNYMMEQYNEAAFRTADSAATLVNADLLPFFLASGKDTELEMYNIEHDALADICTAAGAMFIYVIVPDQRDFWHITFVFSTVNEASSYTEFEFGYVRETTNEDYRDKYMKLYNGTSDREVVIRDAGYIPTDKHITAMVPLINSDGHTAGILCVQYQLDTLTHARNDYFMQVLIAFLCLITIVVLLQWLFTSRLIIKPVIKVTREASRFAAENVKSDKKLSESVKSKDEIGELANSIDEMEEQVQKYTENLAKATAEKERINTELDLAAKIQINSLPDIFPPFPDRKEFDIYASMTPARKVGGDFYDFFLIDDDHLALLIADVAGKGIPASLLMMTSRIIINNTATPDKIPAKILQEANDTICQNNKEDMFVTVWLGILELSTGTLVTANAGHEYPAICRKDGCFELQKTKHGMPLGSFKGLKYKDNEIKLEPGSKIFVYTDGIPEAEDENHNMFGTDRMLESLNQNLHCSAEKTIKNMQQAVNSFVKDAEQFDDMTMVCLDYKGTVTGQEQPESSEFTA